MLRIFDPTEATSAQKQIDYISRPPPLSGLRIGLVGQVLKSSFVKTLPILILIFTSWCSFAQSYPSKLVKVIAPFAPGTGTDAVIRIVSEGLSRRTGKPFVVENRTGAGTTIAAALVAKAPADGYTILGTSTSHTSVPALMKDLPFNTALDFAGVTTLTAYPLVLVIARSKEIQSLKDLIAAAKLKPGAFTFATGGVGSTPHLAAEKLRLAAGFDALHVPFKGAADSISELIAGRITFTYTSPNAALSLLQDSRVIVAATSAGRSSMLPNVQTIEEAGVENAGCCSIWAGLILPSKTPRDIVYRLYDETVKVLATPEEKTRLLKIGAEPSSMKPEEFDSFIKKELTDYARIVKTLNIQPQ